MNVNPKQVERIREARASAHRSDGGEAFLPDSPDTPGSLMQSDGESFAEEFISAATTGEHSEMDAQDEVVSEEWGGPFVELDLEEDELMADTLPEPPPMGELGRNLSRS